MNENVLNNSEENHSSFSLPLEIVNPSLFYYHKRPISKASPFKFIWEKRPCKIIDKGHFDKLIALNAKDVISLDFEEKQIWFYSQIDEKLRISWMNGSDNLTLRKDFILEDTVKTLDSFDLHKELKITFQDDKVLDAGGLMREWIYLIMIKFANSGLFQKADTEQVTYKLNADNEKTDKIVEIARNFGLVLGKAIFEKVPIQLYLDRTIIRCLLSQETELTDIEGFDLGLFRSWSFLKENDIGELVKKSAFDENFEIFHKNKDIFERIELKPGGADIKITELNKHEYIQLSVDFYTKTCVISLLSAILEGFYKVIPLNILQIFDPIEFDMILYGVPTINLADWKTNTIYKGAYYQNHQIIQWFWEVMQGFQQEELANILHFCTGSKRTPVDGFRNLMSNRGKIAKFCIESCKFDKERPYPRGHTCFNRLELPIYGSKEILKEKIEFIAKNELEGVFGLE